jgi:hypothetical protein
MEESIDYFLSNISNENNWEWNVYTFYKVGVKRLGVNRLGSEMSDFQTN